MMLATSLAALALGSAQALPEPQTVLLMLGGLGVVLGAALWAHGRGPR